MHLRVLDLDFGPVMAFTRSLPAQARIEMLQNQRLALFLAFSPAYTHAAYAGKVWPWVQFCLAVEKMFGGQRIQWRYLADANDDVLCTELEVLIYKALDGAGMPQEIAAMLGDLQQVVSEAGVVLCVRWGAVCVLETMYDGNV